MLEPAAQKATFTTNYGLEMDANTELVVNVCEQRLENIKDEKEQLYEKEMEATK